MKKVFEVVVEVERSRSVALVGSEIARLLRTPDSLSMAETISVTDLSDVDKELSDEDKVYKVLLDKIKEEKEPDHASTWACALGRLTDAMVARKLHLGELK